MDDDMIAKLIETGMEKEMAVRIVAAVMAKTFPTGLNLTIRQYYIIGWF